VTVSERKLPIGVLSLAVRLPGLDICTVALRPAAYLGQHLHDCLEILERANCNGAPDINGHGLFSHPGLAAMMSRPATCGDIDAAALLARMRGENPATARR